MLHELARSERDTELARVALYQFAAAVHVNPGMYNVLNDYAGVQFDTGDTDGAILTLQRAVALNPELSSMHFNLGLLLESRGRIPEAIRAYAEAGRLAPGWPPPVDRVTALRGKMATPTR